MITRMPDGGVAVDLGMVGIGSKDLRVGLRDEILDRLAIAIRDKLHLAIDELLASRELREMIVAKLTESFLEDSLSPPPKAPAVADVIHPDARGMT